MSTHLTEKNEQLFNDIQSFRQLQEPEILFYTISNKINYNM